MDYLLLIIGFIILAVGGNFLVDSSVSLAKHLKISTLVVGLVIVSFGTSAPELFVSLQAALAGNSNIAIGNVIGSNISNIALVLGFTALIMPIAIKNKSIFRDWFFMIGISLIFWFFMFDHSINWIEGVILISILVLFIFISFKESKNHLKDLSVEEKEKEPQFNITVSIIILVISCASLILGSRLLVDSAVTIAYKLNISERIISITIVAFGTSVPELSASIMGILKKQSDISIGNIIGSNIFNIGGIIGITSIVRRIDNIENAFITHDSIVMMLISVLLLVMLLLPRKKIYITRFQGGILLLSFIVYIFFLIH